MASFWSKKGSLENLCSSTHQLRNSDTCIVMHPKKKETHVEFPNEVLWPIGKWSPVFLDWLTGLLHGVCWGFPKWRKSRFSMCDLAVQYFLIYFSGTGRKCSLSWKWSPKNAHFGRLGRHLWTSVWSWPHMAAEICLQGLRWDLRAMLVRDGKLRSQELPVQHFKWFHFGRRIWPHMATRWRTRRSCERIGHSVTEWRSKRQAHVAWLLWVTWTLRMENSLRWQPRGMSRMLVKGISKLSRLTMTQIWMRCRCSSIRPMWCCPTTTCSWEHHILYNYIHFELLATKMWPFLCQVLCWEMFALHPDITKPTKDHFTAWRRTKSRRFSTIWYTNVDTENDHVHRKVIYKS